MTEPTENQVTKAIDATTGLDITPYAPRPAVREMAARITQMLPSAKEVGPAGALALAQVAIALELNPFTGELWAWKNKDGTTTLMVGIKGLRRAAHKQARDQGGHYQLYIRLPTDDELEGVTLNPGDVARACTLTLWTDATVQLFKLTGEPTTFHGLGICRGVEKTKMEHALAARKRAEADAIKQCFDLPVAFSVEEAGQPLSPAQLKHFQELEAFAGSMERDRALPLEYPRSRDRMFKTEGSPPQEELSNWVENGNENGLQVAIGDAGAAPGGQENLQRPPERDRSPQEDLDDLYPGKQRPLFGEDQPTEED